MVPFLRAAGYDTDQIGRDKLVLFADAVRENIDTLADASAFAPIFFTDAPPMDEACLSLLAKASSRSVLSAFLNQIQDVPTLTGAAYRGHGRGRLNRDRVYG